MRIAQFGLALPLLLLCGCVTPPIGPTVSVLPGTNKPFEVFQQDQATCKYYANQQTAGGAQMANDKAVAEGAIATGLGAILGGAIGNGRGAAVGAATGAVVATDIGVGESRRAEYYLQQRYNIAFTQCMYAKGNQVPGYAAPGFAIPPPPPPRS